MTYEEQVVNKGFLLLKEKGRELQKVSCLPLPPASQPASDQQSHQHSPPQLEDLQAQTHQSEEQHLPLEEQDPASLWLLAAEVEIKDC